MNNKGLKITAAVLGVIAIGLIIFVSTNSDLREQRAIRAEQKAYEKAVQVNTELSLNQYINRFPDGKHIRVVTAKRDKIVEKKEQDAFDNALQRNSEWGWESFIRDYPNGKHTDEARTRLANFKDDEEYKKASKSDTQYSYEQYLNQYPQGLHAKEAKRKINAIRERDRWLTNHLNNGAQPYARWYGYNGSCDEWGCSQIKVTAPTSSDVVVLIKRNNSNGRTVRHAYIRAGYTYTFEVADGRYQVFFYYGTGWNPNKEMSGGVKGGFCQSELFSKDDPISVSNNVLSYVLQLTHNGNFSTKSSSEYEMF